MNKTSFFFLILCEILKIVFCGSSPLNPFGLQVNQQSKNFELGKEDEKFSFEESIKNLKKQRLFFPGNDIATEIQPDKFSTLTGEYPLRRRNNQSKTEEEQRFSGEIRDYEGDHWENEKNSFSFLEEHKGNVGNAVEYRSRQPFTGPNQNYDWEKGDVFQKSQSKWNDEKIFKHVENPNSDLAFGRPFIERGFNGNINDNAVGKSNNVFDRKISITTLNEPEARNINKYNNNYKLDERHYGYNVHFNTNKNNKEESGFWNQNPYRSEKGVIINLNTECPVARQFNNRFLHKIIFSPKSSVNTHSELSVYQFPGAHLISAHQPTPTYFF